MRFDYIILPDSDPDAPPHWLRVVDGYVTGRGIGADWRHPDDGSDGPIEGTALLVLPPHATTLHWIACPDMTVRQGAQAARIMALEESVAAGGGLHAAVLAADTPEAPHVAAVISESAMNHWIGWCVDRDIPHASFVPAGLMLPAPEDGFLRGQVGPHEVVRGPDSVFAADEPAAALIMGRAPVTDLTEPAIDDQLREALDAPPLELRTGAFAARPPRVFEPERVKRMAVLVGFIFLAMLLVSLVRIGMLNWEAAQIDAKTVSAARTVDPSVEDASDAEFKVAARFARLGGNGGFTGAMAGIITAMRSVPAVSLASVNQGSDGSLRLQFAAPRSEDINAVLLSLQGAGWRIGANAVQQQGGRIVADIVVMR